MSDKTAETVHLFVNEIIRIMDEIEEMGYKSEDAIELVPEIILALETISTNCKDVEMRRSTREFLNKLRSRKMSRYYGPGRCPECDGRKWRPTYYQDGELSIDEDCYECDGTGLSVDAQILWQDLAKNVEKWVWK